MRNFIEVLKDTIWLIRNYPYLCITVWLDHEGTVEKIRRIQKEKAND